MKYYLHTVVAGVICLMTSEFGFSQNADYEKVDNGVIIYFSNQGKNITRAIKLEVVNQDIIHVIKSPQLPLEADTSLMIYEKYFSKNFNVKEINGNVILTTRSLTTNVSLNHALITFSDSSGQVLLAESNTESNFEPAVIESGKSWAIKQSFLASKNEAFYGLGQHQDGLMNYRDNVVTLDQNNTNIAVPFLLSSNRYGILWDNYSITTFSDGRTYQPLDQLKLFTPAGITGLLQATYFLKNDPGKIISRRNESAIDYDFIRDLSRFPDSFDLNKGEVSWEGYIQAPITGLHTFRFRYGGYIKVWLDDSLVLNEWRQCWNPASALLPYNMEAGKRYHFKIDWIPDGGQSFISCDFLRPEDESEKNHYVLQSEAGANIDYYFIRGTNDDDVISGYRTLTGKAQIIPRWALGFWQSRERYKTEKEVLQTVERFRQLKVPLDNIVLDWQYWKPNEWGSEQFDSSRFPDPGGMIETLHKLYHTHIMVSVWPKFYKGIPNYDLLNSKGFLLTRNIIENRKDWLGYVSTFYDAFNPEAGKLFWELIYKNLYRLGIDAFWMDASEPDIYSNLSIAQRKELLYPNALGSGIKYYNAYPLLNARAVYQGERSVAPDKRVFILTRSAYAGSQRYAAAVWSGDIGARWRDMKNQISAGTNFSMSGNPWWTMDIGGFAVEHRYENATGDTLKEWKELMTRWYQFGAFCPIFRVHGQYPYREIFNISSPGEPAYESMFYYDKLRYRLLPYFYSLAGKVYFNDYTIMRGLEMDFPFDVKVKNINDEFLCGNSLLISPVYKRNVTSRKVYLPSGTGWFDLYTGKYYSGGEVINAPAPFARIPVFVKEGSIIPFGPNLQYTSEKKADTISLFVYAGKNADFTLYEDDGLTYQYQNDKSSTIIIHYDETTKSLTLQQRNGSFPGMLQSRVFKIYVVRKNNQKGIDKMPALAREVKYYGQKVTVRNLFSN